MNRTTDRVLGWGAMLTAPMLLNADAPIGAAISGVVGGVFLFLSYRKREGDDAQGS